MIVSKAAFETAPWPILYGRGSQPEVRVPLGVCNYLVGDRPKLNSNGHYDTTVQGSRQNLFQEVFPYLSKLELDIKLIMLIYKYYLKMLVEM